MGISRIICIKNSLLLFFLFLMVSCSENDLLEGVNRPVVSGDEIVFGADAHAVAGNENAKTGRTVYGEPDAKSIPINWCPGDMIDIYSPEAGGINLATYGIPEGLTGNDNTTSILERITKEGGLQWKGNGTHHFYAVYPSSQTMDKYENNQAAISIDKQTKTIKGYMPMAYMADFQRVSDNSPVKYVVQPDMDLAFMAAKAEASLGRNASVNLEFNPLVTALQFDLTAGNITAPENLGTEGYIKLTHLVLESETQNIAGDFQYDFATDKLQNTSEGTNCTRISMFLDKKSQKAQTGGFDVNNEVILKKGEKCDVTFFLLTDKPLQEKSLVLQIWFEYNGYLLYRKARINVDIQARRKYYFKNLTLQTISDMTGSNWFSAIHPDIYVNQLSLLCAGNAFSNIKGIGWYSRQQVKPYDELWKQGVRGFEFVTQSAGKNQGVVDGLKDEHFVCGEIVMDGKSGRPKSDTFHEAFSKLAKYLVDSKELKMFNNEALVLIARYHAVDDPYDPQRFVHDLLDYLDYTINHGIDYTIKNGEHEVQKNIRLTPKHFVQLTPNSTIADIRGKIAIIIRPGDDDYMQWVKNTTTSSIEVKSSAGTDWADRVCLIQNWGSAYDRWDTRFTDADGVRFGREATWTNRISGTSSRTPVMEKYMWGASLNDDSFVLPTGSGGTFGNFVPFPQMQSDFNFKLPVTGNNTGACVQEWARVINNDIEVSGYQSGQELQALTSFNQNVAASGTGKPVYLWYKWKESYSEKLAAIDQLFTEVVQTRGGANTPLYINVLSGYLATTEHINSYEPFMETFDIASPQITFKPQNQGNGGNYAALATKLNTHVYEVLSGKKATSHSGMLNQGPWGLVVADYLDASATDLQDAKAEEYNNSSEISAAVEAGKGLQRLFITNNFTFPLAKKKKVATSEDVDIVQQDDIVVAD